jgi:hypothetical protein
MNRYFFLFVASLFATLISKAVQSYQHSDLEKLDEFIFDEVDPLEISSHFDGHLWLENRMTSQPVDLTQIYQEKMYTKKLSERSEIKRYQKSYSTWIEQRICNESPYIEKPVRANMTSRYGYRTHPMSGRRHVHAGIDFRGRTGTPVLAGSAGRVETVGRKGAYGKTIVINHGNSFTTLYGHLSGYAVKKGDWVNLGQTIGYIGRTGRATGPHLHFEVRCHNVPLNPMKFLGTMGQMAEVKFRRRVRGLSQHRRRQRQPAMVKTDPNYYTRMINLEKLKKLDQKVKRF